MNLEENLIIITEQKYKRKLINENILKYNLKIYTKDEFTKLYYHDYKSDVLLYMYNKFNMIPEIAKIILDNLYKIEDKTYSTNKLNNLVKIKKDLIENGYIIFNNNFKSFIKDKKIIAYNTYYDNYESYFDEYKNKDEIVIYKNNTIEDEIVVTAMMIKELVESGIDINKIKINTLDGSYTGIIDRIFTFFNIPYQFNSTNKLFYLNEVKEFMKNDNNILLEDLSFENINPKIAVKIVNIINKYSNYETFGEIKSILEYEFKNANVDIDIYENVVTEINYKNYLPKDDEYIFMLGFNQDIIPKIHKDDMYLSDKELEELNELNSFKRNEIEEYNLKKFINDTKNLIISYKCSSPSQDFGYSNFLTGLDNLVEITKKYDYQNEPLNKLYLADRLDNYILYNDISDDLIDLYSSYNDIEYKKYENNYEKINYDTIKKQLNNKINLSYSNINVFYQCQFRFLLNNIYCVSDFKETISTIIGKLFHKVLEITYRTKRTDYDNIIDEAINEFYPEEKTRKEEFYLNKYRKLLLQLIEIINENNLKSQFENTYFEQKFEIQKENDLNITIKGFVDKILTFNDGENTYVVVIDYKTGGMHNDFNKVVYGLDMQLLMYLYLIKNTNLIKNPKFSGMYLQKIMTEVLNKDDKLTYDEQVRNEYKLNGYTLNNPDIVSKIDKDYDEKSFIYGMKLKKDGSFMGYSKVLSESEIDEFIEIVSNNIDKMIEALNNCEFDINPKKIKNKNIGCEYCSFKDICYVNNSNIVELESEDENDDTE